ncbi:reverse transcriptase domain-containing protein [Dyadobacter sp. 3J3]|uniref:reverse transcriptase domain-containing protein n=1 Tax=Dyadobacter sp. 3J3 TaxID=2606600 RepID=UPI0013572660|nr:reverse transcriptase domain-containing protein [Dyadobacter sp. 3J3]
MDTENWFKLKKYPHIGLPITASDYDWVKEYVYNKDKIRTHSFLPLIHKCISQRKFRPDKLINDKTKTNRRYRIKDKKDRNIYFASHIDSLIFSYYNSILVEAYEQYIENKNFNESVVAYRKIALFKDSKNNKCNIDFAKTVFEFIKQNDSNKLSVVVADVTSFFDNLDHKIIKRKWSEILNEYTLPLDHYNIFKTLTRIKYIEGEQLFNSYSRTMIVERGIPNNSKKTEFKRIEIEKAQYFKEKNAVAYCEKNDFIKKNLNLIVSKNNTVGIPQGSPISATLANVYMLDFDQIVFNKINAIGGFYQRYSDDLVVVCEQQYEDEIINTIRETIADKKIAGLEIQSKKTKVYRFEIISEKFIGFEIDEKTKLPNFNRTLEYLGFSFDGQKVLVKSAGFSKFYRSMIKSFKKSASLAKNSKNPDKKIFKSRLFKRFTHIGAKRKLIYRPSKIDKTKYVKSKEYNWGNYLSYIYKADNTMKDLNKLESIKKQSRKLWKNFNRLLKIYQ